MEPNKNTAKRCAIYTRKSSEEGLEQSFNSLDAQREAAEAYIRSQQHEGWELNSTQYNDGGFSGGNTDRPDLNRLLVDIKNGKVDIVVVYKVDRLSRSLHDFAKMMDLFDQYNVSFVSITQQFNTTSAMGRLTLNILLSFAQFEREVTGERIRDKIAASKRKGLWMGGRVPLGYNAIDRQLEINLDEAHIVHTIFSLYQQTQSVTTVCKQVKSLGFKTKYHRTRAGELTGGNHFTKQSIYKILNNRIYLGEIPHNGKSFPGQHEPIISEELWHQVHSIFSRKNALGIKKTNISATSPLKGLLFGPDGKAMLSTHTSKGSKKYRYYITQTAHKKGHAECSVGMVRAGDIEGIVFDQLKAIFRHPKLIVSTWLSLKDHNHELPEHEVRKNLVAIESLWDHLFHDEQAKLLEHFIERIDLASDDVKIQIKTHGLDRLAQSLEQHNKEKIKAA